MRLSYLCTYDQCQIYRDTRCLCKEQRLLRTGPQVCWHKGLLPDGQRLPYNRRDHNPHQRVHCLPWVGRKLIGLIQEPPIDNIFLWPKHQDAKTLTDDAKDKSNFERYCLGTQSWTPTVGGQACSYKVTGISDATLNAGTLNMLQHGPTVIECANAATAATTTIHKQSSIVAARAAGAYTIATGLDIRFSMCRT